MRHVVWVLITMLILITYSGTFPHANGLTYNSTIKDSYPSGTPTNQGKWQCLDGGVLTTYTGSTTGITATCDASSILYPIAIDSSGTSTEQWSATPLTYGLTDYWPFDEGTGSSAYDLSGNANTVTLTNSPTWDSGASCKFGDCLSFARARSQYINISSSNTTQQAGSFTICVWAVSSSAGIILSKGDGSVSGTNYELSYNPDFEIYISTSSSHYSIGDGIPRDDGIWHFDCGVYDSGVNRIYAYVDGNCNAGCSKSTGGTIVTNTSPMTIAKGSLGVDYFNGQIDDAREWSRALSASEIQELYSSSSPNLEIQITSGGNTYTTNFYNQFHSAFQITSINHVPLNGSMTLQITETSLGNSLAAICSVSTNTSSVASCKGWIDNSSSVIFPQFLSNPPPNTEWENIANSSSTLIITKAGTYNIDYYCKQSSGQICGSQKSIYSSEITAAIAVIVVIVVALVLEFSYFAMKRRTSSPRKSVHDIGEQNKGKQSSSFVGRTLSYLKSNWGSPFIGVFIVLLTLSAIELGPAATDSSSTIATYAFYSLVIGVTLQIASYIKYGEGTPEDKEKALVC